MNRQSNVTFVPAFQQETLQSTGDLQRHNQFAKKNPSQTFYNVASQPAVTTMDQQLDMKRGSMGLADNSQTTINIDVMATVRTHDDQNQNAFLPTIDLRNSKDSNELSMHEKKEAEIYQTIATSHPNRHIHLVDQKTEEQKKMEAEHKLHKTYDRISLPDVARRRGMLGVSPHTRV